MEDDRRLVGSLLYITARAAIKDLTGDGVGATRLVYMLDGSAQWNEKTVEYDAAGMS